MGGGFPRNEWVCRVVKGYQRSSTVICWMCTGASLWLPCLPFLVIQLSTLTCRCQSHPTCHQFQSTLPCICVLMALSLPQLFLLLVWWGGDNAESVQVRVHVGPESVQLCCKQDWWSHTLEAKIACFLPLPSLNLSFLNFHTEYQTAHGGLF